MNRLLTAILIMFVAIPAGANTNEVIRGDDGIFWSGYDGNGTGTFMYYVDTVTQLCFVGTHRATNENPSVIPCSALAKRPEWKPIINWVSE